MYRVICMPPPLVCATVHAATTRELCARRDEVVGADLVELRLDSLNEIDVTAALQNRRLPVIVTCRPGWEGGLFGGSEEERRRIPTAAIVGGADYVDIEWAAGFDDLVASRGGRGIVLSMHDHGGVPRDLDAVHLPLVNDSADDVIGFAEALGIAGLSVTAPLKVSIPRHATELDADAARVGAVNTLTCTPGGWRGSNTDLAGFLEPLGTLGSLVGLRVALLVAQAARRIALWTGREADREVMRQAAAAGLERCAQDQVRALPATGGHAAVEA